MNILSIFLFSFSILLLLHSARDFLQHWESKVWFARAGHEKQKILFDSICDKLGLSFLKDKEWLHALICAFFGLVFLAVSLLVKNR